jgi:hypothetical protein
LQSYALQRPSSRYQQQQHIFQEQND